MDDLRSIMLELGWTFTEHRDGRNWYALADVIGGAGPPFSEVAMLDVDADPRERGYSFRLGPLEGPVEMIRRVAVDHGSQVALTGSYGYPALITADIPFDEVERALTTRRDG